MVRQIGVERHAVTLAERVLATVHVQGQRTPLDDGGLTRARLMPRGVPGAAGDGARGQRVARDLGAQAGQRRGEDLVGVAAGAATGGPGDPPMHEPGARETTIVEAGALTLLIDGAEHALAAGDSVTFDADLPHHFENHGKEEAVLLAIVSAGLRRS